MECDICKQKKQTFDCDNCIKKICKTCANLTASEVKVMELAKRILKFYCRECENFHALKLMKKLVDSKTETIASKDETIAILKQELHEAKKKSEQFANQTSMQCLSYADAIRQHSDDRSYRTWSKPTPLNVPNLVIKPKAQQGSDKTKSDIMKQIKPAELNISINKIRPTKSGHLIIKCNDTKNTQKLKTEIEQKLSDEYEVEESKLRNPQIKIVGHTNEDKLTVDQLEESIRNQNSFITEDDTFTITYIKETNNKTIFAECCPGLFRKIMFQKKIYIGWERYPVYENLSVKQCFKCNGFYHNSEVCKSVTKCSYCGGEHAREECSMDLEMKCSNCEVSNQKYQTTHNLAHESTDPECPTYKHHLQIIKSKINYG